ncbi:MAG: DUF126 domain-containing protein [Planctomycetes bacterium]|nr:DUF126 domain-containing protein [Planctomycetota bacterium]
MVERILIGKAVVSGTAEGEAVVTDQPISFWGGLNTETGEIIDRRHEKSGTNVTGKVFVFPQGRGSSTSSAILAESIRNGTNPAAIINLQVEPILALGSIVSDELYHQSVPVLVMGEYDFYSIKDGDQIRIEADGKVHVLFNS